MRVILAIAIYVLPAAAAILVLMWVMSERPTCREGYVPQWSTMYQGWNCVAGYRPNG